MEKDFFEEIVKCGSITEAAMNLYISQPALSAKLRHLEERIGASLIDRSSYPLRPTEIGKLYLETLRKHREIDDEFVKKTVDLGNLSAGSVTVGGAHYITFSVLLEGTDAFQKKYPGIRVNIVEANSADLDARLLSGELDFILDYDFHPDSEIAVPLMEEEIFLCVPEKCDIRPAGTVALSREDVLTHSRAYLSAAPVSLLPFADRRFVLLRPGNNMQAHSRDLFDHENLKPNVILETDQLVTAYYAASRGYGLTFVTDHILRNTEAGGAVRFYRLPGELSRRNLFMIRAAKNYRSLAATAFWDTLAGERR